jgi:FixJ family two-component response regulator
MTPKHAVVAVIDDNVAILDAMKRLLSTFGYNAELYASAAAFRSAVARTEAICLIVDIELGDASGLDLSNELASAGFRIPVILMSANNNELDAIRDVKNCVAFLRKPFSPEELIDALSKLPPRTPVGNLHKRRR